MDNTSTIPVRAVAGERTHGPPYLNSHRALAARTREFARLSTDVVRRVMLLHEVGELDRPVVRQTPDRLIVQLGPVALTIAWLRSTLDTVDDGELLLAVWRGAVAPQVVRRPERPATTSAEPTRATMVWESVCRAVAHDEASWQWLPSVVDQSAECSGDLAARCVAELELAYRTSPMAQ